MNLRKTVVSALALILAAVLSVLVGAYAATVIERRSVADVSRTLELNGLDWVQVQADGLQVILSGDARDEASRFQAIRTAGQVVDAARVIDMMETVVPDPIQPPRFSIEILRNDDSVSLIGLVPAETGVEDIVKRVSDIRGAERVAELLDEASYDPPENWQAALDYGISALSILPRSKISISADKVEIVAAADSTEERRKLETRLRRDAPDAVPVAIDIAAPRPVVTPYTLRFLIDERGARFDACTTDTQDGAQRILAAARAFGLPGQARCTIGLGVPSPDWDDAVIAGIRAVGELGAGSVTFSDADVTLVGTPDMDAEEFDRVSGTLESDLPEAFSLKAVLPEPPAAEDDADAGPPEFVATLSPEGLFTMRGPIADPRMRRAVQSVAHAAFGADTVKDGMRERADLPIDWGKRIFAAIEAMGQLKNGLVRMRPDLLEIRGETGNADAQAQIAGLLAERLGGEAKFTLDVTYREELDPLANIPTPQECVSRINAVLEAQKITFAPSSAEIDDSARDTISKIVDIMRECDHVPMEVAGHTDSQGREIMNKELSQARADAVVNALLARRVLTSNLRAVGYGEEQPIADNDTEEGREANRRIEFRLIEESDPATDAAEAGEANPQGEGQTDAAPEDGAQNDAAADDAAATQTPEPTQSQTDQTETPDE